MTFDGVVEKRHILALQREKIFFSLTGSYERSWVEKAGKISIKRPLYTEQYSCFIGGGNFFMMGTHSYSKSRFQESMKIGRYCSIAGNVTVMPPSHPMDRLSTCGLDYSDTIIHPEGFKKIQFKQKPFSLEIGNDVWIAEGAVLGRNIKIGHGAVIGTKAVVTKDVPPYAVVAGVPAVVKKYRFSEVIIQRLLEAQWWDIDPSELTDLDTTNPEAFLDELDKLKQTFGDLKPYKPKVIDLLELFKNPDTPQ